MANSLHAHADPPMNENLGRNSPENDVLVAGATSLIGRFLLSRARAAGLRSLALSRRGGEVRAAASRVDGGQGGAGAVRAK